MLEAKNLIDTVLSAMAHRGYMEQDAFHVRLILEEAFVNAIKHGNQHDLHKRVSVEYEVTSRRVLARVTDEGEGFDPAQVPDPTLPENVEKPTGRGLMLMRQFSTWVRFNRQGNQVILCKYRSQPAS